MAVNPPFNNPQQGFGPQPLNLGQFNDDVKQSISYSNELSNTLKIVVERVKEIGSGKNFEKFGEVLSKFEEIKNKLGETQKQLQSQNQLIQQQGSLSQDLAKKIDDGVKARTKLTELSNDLRDAQIEYNKKLEEGKATANDFYKVDRLKSTVDLLNQQAAEYEGILTGQSLSLQNASEEVKEAIKKYALLKNIEEQQNIFIKNHQAEYDALKQILGEEGAKKAIREYQLKIAKEQTNEILKQSYIYQQINKTKSFFVDLLGLEKLSLLNLIKGAFDLNKIYTDSAKQLGISASNAREIANTYATTAPTANTIAAAGNNLLQTRKNELEAMGQINSALGTAANLSKERVQEQVSLVKNMGLEAGAATKIQFLSLVSGKTNKEILDNVNNQVISLGKQTGVYLDNRKILADVAKVEGQLAAQYKNNPDLIAKAVIQTKQLGIELSQAASMSDKLLNFQSSIQNELEAELLIGKALNLEIARELALRGDSVAAAKEMLNQVGSLEDFQNLNVLQQRSLAQAIGMSADELANSLKTQDLLLKTGDKSVEALNERRRLAIETGKTEEFYAELRRAGTSEEMIANQMQLSNQDKMNILVDKMLETFSNMVEPLTSLVGNFSDLVSSAGAFKALAITIASLWGAKIAFSIASTVTSLRQANAALVIQRGIQDALLKKKQQEAVLGGVNAAFSTGPGFPFAIAAVGAILAGVGIATSLGSFSSGEESIKKTSPNVENPNQSSSNLNNQNSKPVEVTINLGGNTFAKFNTENNKSKNTVNA
jgi:hypothetical protein